MKLFKIPFLVLFLSLFLGTITSCGQLTLPNDVLQDDVAYNKLTDYIYSHYPNLKEGMEVMNFDYSASIHPQRDELSSFMTMEIVRGDNKDAIIQYSLDNQSRLTNNTIEISVGDGVNQTVSNKYETFEPHLFSDKLLNMNTLREIVAKATEDFKKEANVENAYCASIGISKEPGEETKIGVTIKQRQFSTQISRRSNWTIDGKKID